ncbi:pyrolysin [Thermococcus sp. GR7]|nr:pyrolysin [Thermococcus sp. GR7]NJE78691.1 pyrolysin [Thermococcus sp. GR4]NJF22425.1 pyrolysin [Thermococcus sp. GR5]
MGPFGPGMVSAKPISDYNVLILKSVDAWSSPAVENTLTDIGVPYDVMTSGELKNKTAQELIETYDMIIIVSDQPQAFYDDLGTQMDKLEEYVRAGRTLEIHAANWGWHRGVWTTPLPGGAEIVQGYSSHDYLIANGTTLVSSYASHGYFINLPANAEIITVQAPSGTPDYNKPSTAIYSLGSGKVFVTGLTIEYSIARKGPEWEAFFREMLMNNLGYSQFVPVAPVIVIGGIDFMTFNFYYIQYKRALEKFNTMYREAVAGGMDNETLGLAMTQNDTAATYYANASRYDPVVSNFPRVYIFIDLREAALHQKQAVGILKEAMEDW